MSFSITASQSPYDGHCRPITFINSAQKMLNLSYELEIPEVSNEKRELIILKFSELNEKINSYCNHSVILKQRGRIYVVLEKVRYCDFEFLGSIAEERLGSLKKVPNFIDIANHGGKVNCSLSHLGGRGFELALHFWLF
jgi:hypothetical protein